MKTIEIREETILTRFYNPVTLQVESGEQIGIAQRDGGFEIIVPGKAGISKLVFIKDGQVSVKNLIKIEKTLEELKGTTLGNLCKEAEEEIFKSIPLYRRWLAKLIWKYR